MWSHMSFVAVFALFPKLSPLLFQCFCYSLRLWGDFPHLCFLFVPTDLLPPAFSSHFFYHSFIPTSHLSISLRHHQLRLFPFPSSFLHTYSLSSSLQCISTSFLYLLSHLFLPSFSSLQVLLNTLSLSNCLPPSSALTFIQVMNNFWADPALPQQVAFTHTHSQKHQDLTGVDCK